MNKKQKTYASCFTYSYLVVQVSGLLIASTILSIGLGDILLGFLIYIPCGFIVTCVPTVIYALILSAIAMNFIRKDYSLWWLYPCGVVLAIFFLTTGSLLIDGSLDTVFFNFHIFCLIPNLLGSGVLHYYLWKQKTNKKPDDSDALKIAQKK